MAAPGTQSNVRYDIVIVGGGPVGMAFALALRSHDGGSGRRVLLLDAGDGGAGDRRVLALSYGSRLLLERLGVWQSLAEATPISAIHVSQRGRFGRTSLRAEELRLPALGYVIDYAGLQTAMRVALRTPSRTGGGIEPDNLDYLTGAAVTTTTETEDFATVEFAIGAGGTVSQAKASLVVFADGGAAPGKAAASDAQRTRVRDYHQVAVVAQVAAARPHRNVAYERFTECGPVALLPFGARMALVWATAPAHASELVELGEARFLQELHAHFGDRLGDFVSASQRGSFPLRLSYVSPSTAGRVVRIGNAAQTLHPVAGQGFNLGLRDAWQLALELNADTAVDAGSDVLLNRYRSRRLADRRGGIFFTDTLVRLFSNDSALLGLLRGAGLSALDCLPAAKRFLMRRMVFGAMD